MTLSEAFAEGGQVTGVGLLIVFSVLIILMIVLCLFKVIFYKDPKKNAVIEASAPVVPDTNAVNEEDEDEDELIAVLTAAVAASLNTTTYNLQIKSYRRVNNNKSAWNRAGLSETLSNRL